MNNDIRSYVMKQYKIKRENFIIRHELLVLSFLSAAAFEKAFVEGMNDSRYERPQDI